MSSTDGPKTPFDTPEVIRERHRLCGLVSTDSINTKERNKLRKRILDQAMNLNYEPDERKWSDGQGGFNPKSGLKSELRAIVIIGPPAAGKSTLAHRLAEKNNALLIDSDVIKSKLPEYDSGRNASQVHIESTQLASDALEQAILAGHNIVLPKVGGDARSLDELIQLLIASGYEVYLVLNDLDRGKATERCLARWEETGRFIDPWFVYHEIADKPRKS